MTNVEMQATESGVDYKVTSGKGRVLIHAHGGDKVPRPLSVTIIANTEHLLRAGHFAPLFLILIDPLRNRFERSGVTSLPLDHKPAE